MTIAALPEDTVRLLGSHAVIITPVNLVKELLDNAIDAKATSVEILVSPNVVDKVEVRDNGIGIHPDDYDSLGRAGHTSKIMYFEDLRTLGGTTLGFRGQALASANNLGTVTVTTRTSDDPTAVVLKLCPGVGGVESQQRSPAPVGTAVAVFGLYSRLPVRQQVAVKDALRNITKVTQLLQAYALARPQIRLSFRVLGGANKSPFMYSPRSGAGVKEAVVQVFGTDLASQCLVETVYSTAENEHTAEKEKFCIQAVLPRPDADQACIFKGPFFSVDSRPVSARRETMKKLLATFKTHFSTFVERTYGEKSFRDPFIYVNIRCSPGSYDPNIEPSKDVVLFANEGQVTDLFERLCVDVYKSPETLDPLVTFEKRHLPQSSQIQTPPISSDGPEFRETTPVTQHDHLQTGIPRSDIFQPESFRPDVPHQRHRHMKNAPLPNSSSPARERPNRHVPSRQPAPARTGGGFAIDMSADPDMSSDEDVPQEQTVSQSEEQDEDSREALNPWVIAKMTAPVRQNPAPQEQEHLPLNTDEVFENLPILRPFGEAPGDLDDSRQFRVGITQMDRQQQLPGFQSSFDRPTFGNPIDNHPNGPGPNPSGFDTLQPPSHASEANDMRTLPNMRSYHNGTPEDVQLGGLIQSRLDFGGQPRRPHNNRDGEARRHIDDIPSRNNPPFRKPNRVNAGKRHPLVPASGNFNHHVAEWVDNHRLPDYEVGSAEHPSSERLAHSPHPSTEMSTTGNIDRRRVSAGTPFRDQGGGGTWVDGDSRKFLMKRQRSEAEHRRKGRPTLKRFKTDSLPLETVPDSQGLHSLVLTVSPDTEKLAKNLDEVVGDDSFCDALQAQIKLNEEMGLDDAVEIEAKLRNLFGVWTEKVMGKRTEVNIDLRTQVKGKSVAV